MATTPSGFTKTSVNGRLVASEGWDTLANAGTVNGTTIDFIKKDQNFVLIINTAAVGTAGVDSATFVIEGSHDGTTFVTLVSDPVAFDAATGVYHYVNATSGDMPYYRISITSSGDDSGVTTMAYVIVT